MLSSLILNNKLIKPKFPFIVDKNHHLSKGLLRWWLLNDSAGSIVRDFSGNGKDGLMTSMTPSTAWIGSNRGPALKFDGTDDYIDTDSISIADDTAWTFSAWINLRTSKNYHGFSGNLYTTGSYARMYCGTTGSYIYLMNDNNGWVRWTGATPAPGNWFHFVIAVDGSDVDNIELYIDSVSKGINTKADTSYTLDKVGSGGATATNMLDGSMQDVRLYNRRLSESEIKELYTNPYDNLISTMPLQIISGGSIVDISGSTNLSFTNNVSIQGEKEISGTIDFDFVASCSLDSAIVDISGFTNISFLNSASIIGVVERITDLTMEPAPLKEGLESGHKTVVDSKSWSQWFTKLVNKPALAVPNDDTLFLRGDDTWTEIGAISIGSHASSHEANGTDSVELDQSQITGLTTDLSNKTDLSHDHTSGNGGTLDHTNLTNIGSNSHSQIDSHISDSNIHFNEISIDHMNISNVGNNTHVQLDSHVANTNQHIDHANVNIITGSGLSGGGNLSSNISLSANDSEIDHDSLLNFVSNKHIDWTNANTNLYTTGSGRFSNTLGVGTSPISGSTIYTNRISSNSTGPEHAIEGIISQNVATIQDISAGQTVAYSTHSSGTIGTIQGYYGGVVINSNSAVSSASGIYGGGFGGAGQTASVTVLAGFQSVVAAENLSVTFGLGQYITTMTKNAGSISYAVGIYVEPQTAGSLNWAAMFGSDVLMYSGSKLYLEGSLVTNGDSFLTFDTTNNWIEIWAQNHESLRITSSGIDVNGDAVIGDSSNYTSFSSDGTLRMVGDATAYDDLRVPMDSVKTGGSKDPDFAQFKDNGSGSQGVFMYWFDGSTEEELYFSVQMPHCWKQGSNIIPHVHWVPSANGSANQFVKWGLEYTWSNVSGTYPDTTIISTDASDASNATIQGDTTMLIDKHYISTFGEISGSGKTLSSMMICRIFRDATDSDDDYPSDAGLMEFDIHYEIDSLGSDTEYGKA